MGRVGVILPKTFLSPVWIHNTWGTEQVWEAKNQIQRITHQWLVHFITPSPAYVQYPPLERVCKPLSPKNFEYTTFGVFETRKSWDIGYFLSCLVEGLLVVFLPVNKGCGVKHNSISCGSVNGKSPGSVLTYFLWKSFCSPAIDQKLSLLCGIMSCSTNCKTFQFYE